MCGIARQAKHCMRAAIRKVSVTGNGKLNSSCHCVLQADLDAAVDAMPTAASRRTAKRHQARLEAAGQGKSCMRPRKNRKRQRDTAASHPYPSQVRLDLAALRPACDLNGPSRSKHLRTHLSCHRIRYRSQNQSARVHSAGTVGSILRVLTDRCTGTVCGGEGGCSETATHMAFLSCCYASLMWCFLLFTGQRARAEAAA